MWFLWFVSESPVILQTLLIEQTTAKMELIGMPKEYLK